MALRPMKQRSQRTSVRFPRKRNRLFPLFLLVMAFCLTVWGIFSIISFFASDSDAPEEMHPQARHYTTPQENFPNASLVESSAPQSNAHIVAQAAQSYRVKNSTLSTATAETPPATTQPIATQPTASQGRIDASLTRNIQSAPSGQKPNGLHNNISWNIPYVGQKLEDIATTITRQYPSLRAKSMEFQPAGIQKKITFPSSSSAKNLCLTINGCGPFGSDGALFQLLQKEKIPTTFFLSSTWTVKHKKDFSSIEKEPLFTIQAHGKKHLPLSLKGEHANGVRGTDSILAIVREVEGNARDIQRLTNKRPQWYRGAFGMYDKGIIPVIAKELSLPFVGYSLDANVATANDIVAKLLTAKSGDIIRLRFSNGNQLSEALAVAIPQLRAQGFSFVPLLHSSQ